MIVCIGSVTTLTRKYSRAKVGLAASREAFDAITETADKVKISRWAAQADKAAKSRAENVKAMDIYNNQQQAGENIIDAVACAKYLPVCYRTDKGLITSRPD
jgi:hypothetical protein